MSNKIDNWFTEWFDSDHYHLLYQHRNDNEAEEFIQNLFGYLNIEKGSNVLDLACGKGRHALQVHQLGYDVVGLDLSEESIAHARNFEEEGLKFVIGDMRELEFKEKFDITLNLFTSFGYFRGNEENKKVLRGLANHLEKDGRIVLDYLNVKKAVQQLPNEELITREGIDFKTIKSLQEDFIVKDIEFRDEEREFHFREYVKYLDLPKFISFFSELGMEICETFGDYKLNPFEEKQSERLIMIAKFK